MSKPGSESFSKWFRIVADISYNRKFKKEKKRVKRTLKSTFRL